MYLPAGLPATLTFSGEQNGYNGYSRSAIAHAYIRVIGREQVLKHDHRR